MIHILYRACIAEKTGVRPPFYSKRSCARSLIRSIRSARVGSVHLFIDGHDPIEIVEEFKCGYEGTQFVRLASVGNSGSFRIALQLALAFADDDIVYFVEDDYLHVREALGKLQAAFLQVPNAHYVTLYDHPARYMPTFIGGADLIHRESRIFLAGSHHWRSQESTCMTFAARTGTLREDRGLFEAYLSDQTAPSDRELFRHLQGLGRYRKRSPRRLLIGPMPSLATHCHLPWLAPGIDWASIAQESTLPHESTYRY
jgi:hypothetical protein